MKRLFTFISIFCCLFPMLVSAQGITLPQEVDSYYKTRNFVAAFSTLPERNSLANYGSIEALPSHLSSSRLRKVFRAIQALQSWEFTVDKGITGQQVIVSGILQVEKVWRVNDKNMLVKALVYDLGARANALLIALYDKGDEIDLSKHLPNRTAVSHREIHEWSIRNDHWFKKAVNIVLIGK